MLLAKKNLQVLFRRQKLICRGCSSCTTGRLLLAGLWLQPDWTNILGNSDKYYLQFGQIQFSIWTNTSSNLNRYILLSHKAQLADSSWLNSGCNQTGQIHYANQTKSICNLDKYILQFKQLHSGLSQCTSDRLLLAAAATRLDKYIRQFRHILFSIWTNTSGNSKKYILLFHNVSM